MVPLDNSAENDFGTLSEQFLSPFSWPFAADLGTLVMSLSFRDDFSLLQSEVTTDYHDRHPIYHWIMSVGVLPVDQCFKVGPDLRYHEAADSGQRTDLPRPAWHGRRDDHGPISARATRPSHRTGKLRAVATVVGVSRGRNAHPATRKMPGACAAERESARPDRRERSSELPRSRRSLSTNFVPNGRNDELHSTSKFSSGGSKMSCGAPHFPTSRRLLGMVRG